ncbi:hypothetical protein FQA39_LY00920 [Lamprigera yunnana]|nr:hypothetical protein FQA39_LY00920 [Lamprigera yunnana]
MRIQKLFSSVLCRDGNIGNAPKAHCRTFACKQNTEQNNWLSQNSSYFKPPLTIIEKYYYTLLIPRKLQEVAKELKTYKVDIAGLQEIRWSEEAIADKEEYAIWFAGEKKQAYGEQDG